VGGGVELFRPADRGEDPRCLAEARQHVGRGRRRGLALDQYLAGANGNDGQVDALDYAERQAFQWVSGSENFSRPQDFSPGAGDTATGVTTQIAISYSAGSGTETITGCLNGHGDELG